MLAVRSHCTGDPSPRQVIFIMYTSSRRRAGQKEKQGHRAALLSHPHPMSPLTLPRGTRTELSLHFFPSDSDFYYYSKMEVGGGPGKEGEPPGRAPEHSCPLTRSPSVHRWAPISIPSPPRPIAREPSKPTGKSVPCAREPCGWATTPTPKAFLTQ